MELRNRYAGEYMINRKCILNALSNSKVMRKESMNDHISSRKSLHARLASISNLIEDIMDTAISFSSLSNENEYKPLIASGIPFPRRDRLGIL